MYKWRSRVIPLMLPVLIAIGGQPLRVSQAAGNQLNLPEGSFGSSSPGELWGSFIQVMIVLIVIIGMILLFVKLLSKKNKSWFGNRAVRMLGGVQLGPNKSLQMIEVGRTIYLIGVGENVNLLYRIDDEEEIQTIMDSLNDDSATVKWAGWSRLNDRLFKRNHQHNDWRVDEPEDTNASFQQIFHDKMKHVSGRKQKLDEWLAEQDKGGTER